MAIKGKPFLFHVEAFNSSGDVVPAVDPITVTSDNGVVSINPDGTSGVDTPDTVGTMNLSAASGALAASLSEPVGLDVQPVGIRIVAD